MKATEKKTAPRTAARPGATKPWREIRAQRFTPDEIAEVDRKVAARVLEMDLRELRESLGKTQVEMAQALDVAQSQLSRLEKRADHRLSTLRRIVEALGGELEVIANFGNRRIRLRGA